MSSPLDFPRIRVAAIIVQEGRVLLVQHAKDGRQYWMLPGGGVDFGESLTEALVRELREETGVEIRPERLVLASDAIPPDKHRHILNLCFTAEIVGGTPRMGEDSRLSAVEFLPVEDLVRILFYPAYSAELLEMIRAGFPESSRYLGNLWQA